VGPWQKLEVHACVVVRIAAARPSSARIDANDETVERASQRIA
jgi:hypothetical protein